MAQRIPGRLEALELQRLAAGVAGAAQQAASDPRVVPGSTTRPPPRRHLPRGRRCGGARRPAGAVRARPDAPRVRDRGRPRARGDAARRRGFARIGHFGYGHIETMVEAGEVVRAGQPIGWTWQGSWHVHLSEFVFTVEAAPDREPAAAWREDPSVRGPREAGRARHPLLCARDAALGAPAGERRALPAGR